MWKQLNGSENIRWSGMNMEIFNQFSTRRYLEKPSDERVVWLHEVFLDKDNRGLLELRSSHLLKAGGVKVKNLKHLRELLRLFAKKSSKEIVKLEFSQGKIGFINLKKASSINDRILKRYSIPKISSLY